jgi:amino acid adenylation domain-containing protein
MMTKEAFIFPTSFAQQRLWFLNQLDPGQPVYTIPWAIDLDGALQVETLYVALQAIVDRHEALRTTFVAMDGSPIQVVAEHQSIQIPMLDLTDLPHAQRALKAQQLAVAEARRPFDPAAGPLMRMTLLRLGAYEHLLLLMAHHMIFDVWSREVFFKELAQLYAAFAAGGGRVAPPLPPLPIQYADYAHWQREWLQGAVLERQLAYWKRQLDGAPTVLELPTDRPRPPVQLFQGEQHALVFPQRLADAITSLSHQSRVTPFMTLLAMFKVLLYRYTGQRSVVIGTPIANRRRAETAALIGFFANMLVLRTDLSGDPSFRTLLRRICEVALGAYDHQDLPFEKLVEELRPERDLNHTPLFQVAFSLQTRAAEAPPVPGLDVRITEINSGTAKFDLTLNLVETPGGLAGTLVYNTALFDAATIARMAGHFTTLLESIVADPDRRIGDLDLLTAGEQMQLLREWNDTTTDYPRHVCVHQMFETQVAQTPDAVALILDDTALTYQELNQRTNRLAHFLRNLGIGPGTYVGISMERSFDVVVGYLGILKAGGAYLPLDPTYPAERLRFMIEDSQARVLITDQSIYDLRFTIDDLEESQTAIVNRQSKIVNLRADWPLIVQQSAENPQNLTTAEHPAYVIYTSGSTGVPKGSCIPHRAINRLVLHTNYVTISPDDRMSMVANTSFDAATFEVWGALLCGARLAVGMRDVVLEPWRFAAFIHDQRISTIFLTTSLFNQIARELPSAFSAVRQLVVGGEALDPRWIGEVLRHSAPRRLLNGYGPTESTTFATWHLVRQVAEGASTIPIGRPLSNTTIYILDVRMRPVPVGVAGELYIGGDGLALGYLNRPDLTAECFVPNPWESGVRVQGSGVTTSDPRTPTPDPSSRLYKTGDLARYMVDGSAEFLGRLNQQVKLRGFRIELGEIAVVLAQHPAVREAVVLLREDAPGDARLVAYVVMTTDERRTTKDTEQRDPALGPGPWSGITDLRMFLSEKLPAYMVPTAFVALDALPITPNGKLNRRALPLPAFTELEDSYVAPRTPVERALVDIWTHVLRIEQEDDLPPIGIHDNFFVLGGHSLLATRIMSRVRDTLEVDLPLRCLFEAPTVAGLAAAVAQSGQTAPSSAAALVQPTARDVPAPLSFAQQRLWFLHQMAPDNPFYNMAMALRISGPLEQAALERSLGALVQRHEILRTAFAIVDGAPVQIIAPAAAYCDISIPVRDLAAQPPDERQAQVITLARQEARRPFDLTSGHLLRAELLRLGDAEHVLLLTMHHIIADGWSLGVLFRELASHYAAFISGQSAQLSALPLQYADFARWQRQWLQGEVLGSQLEYWKHQLAGASGVLVLPSDRPPPPVRTYRGTQQPLVIPRPVSDALKALGHAEGTTLFMMLLAAFNILLYRYTDQTDLLVGTPITNRTRSEIEGLIGCFVNTLVLRTDLSGSPTFRNVLAQVREVALEAYAHQDLPFEKLVEELQPTRDLSRNPLFQVMFNLQDVQMQTWHLPPLSMQLLPVDIGVAQFDLSLVLIENEQGVRGFWEYNTDIFDAATVVRMVGHFQTLLQGIAANPDCRIATVPLMALAEQQALLDVWCGAALDNLEDDCLQHLVEAQAERHRDAIAVLFDNVRLTYRALNRRANQLAHYLRRLGVGPDVCVGVCLERSLDLVVALLGVLKAGGAYVPLDPAYPQERLAFMLQDAQVAVRLVATTDDGRRTTDDGGAEPVVIRLSSVVDQVVDLAADWPRIDQELETCPDSGVTAENLAYVIYTSGSTGVPKGVAVRHASVVNLVRSMALTLEVSPDDRLLAVTTIAFDIAAIELFLPLTTGGQVVLAPREAAADGPALEALVRASGVTMLQATPATYQLLLETAPTIFTSPRLRAMICGGEALPHALADALLAYPVALWNQYGPTETTIWSSGAAVAAPGAPISLGRPFANTQLYVLDRHGQLAPPGVPGELHIGGAGVARGYLNRPALTAERFVPNPFAGGGDTETWRHNYSQSAIGTRLYATGDRVRHWPDGTLEFLGRIDGQIKLRGVRIELGEIEAMLSRHPAARAAVVTVREDVSGDRRLVAYVVMANDERRMTNDESASSSFVLRPSSVTSELRDFLKEHLPDAMIPAAFVVLDALPRLPNGKVNRGALPTPDGARPAMETAYVAPETALEHTIAGIWQSLLGVSTVGLYDNFFDLGGHSLLMIQVRSQLQERLHKDVPLVDMFRYHTIKDFARYLEQPLDRPSFEASRARAGVRGVALDEQRDLRQKGRAARRQRGVRDE